MKHKTKKFLAISFVFLSVATLLIWYFFPVLVTNLFLYNSADIQRYLNVKPSYIDKLPESPAGWDSISIDTLTLKLPMSKYKRISGSEVYHSLNLISCQGALTIFDLVPPEELLKLIQENKSKYPHLKYPHLSYSERLAIVKTLPADISFLNSRRQNEISSANLILKAIAIPMGGFGDVQIVDPKILKAICIISDKKDNVFSAVVDLYSQNESMSFTILFSNYKDKSELNSDLLNILAGVKLSNHPLDATIAGKDIKAIVDKYKKTEQVN